jgi:hypothetical protein
MLPLKSAMADVGSLLGTPSNGPLDLSTLCCMADISDPLLTPLVEQLRPSMFAVSSALVPGLWVLELPQRLRPKPSLQRVLCLPLSQLPQLRQRARQQLFPLPLLRALDLYEGSYARDYAIGITQLEVALLRAQGEIQAMLSEMHVRVKTMMNRQRSLHLWLMLALRSGVDARGILSRIAAERSAARTWLPLWRRCVRSLLVEVETVLLSMARAGRW